MNAVSPLHPVASGYTTQPIIWTRSIGSAKFDYPIDYWVAILGANLETGRIDFLSKWEPNAYCHYHRHLGPMSVLVLEGEQHIIETTPFETIHKVRKPGFYTHSAGGDVHMEHGGPSGAVVLFSCQAVDDGKLFEVLDRQGKVLATATIQGFLDAQKPRA